MTLLCSKSIPYGLKKKNYTYYYFFFILLLFWEGGWVGGGVCFDFATFCGLNNVMH